MRDQSGPARFGKCRVLSIAMLARPKGTPKTLAGTKPSLRGGSQSCCEPRERRHTCNSKSAASRLLRPGNGARCQNIRPKVNARRRSLIFSSLSSASSPLKCNDIRLAIRAHRKELGASLRPQRELGVAAVGLGPEVSGSGGARQPGSLRANPQLSFPHLLLDAFRQQLHGVRLRAAALQHAGSGTTLRCLVGP